MNIKLKFEPKFALCSICMDSGCDWGDEYEHRSNWCDKCKQKRNEYDSWQTVQYLAKGAESKGMKDRAKEWRELSERYRLQMESIHKKEMKLIQLAVDMRDTTRDYEAAREDLVQTINDHKFLTKKTPRLEPYEESELFDGEVRLD